MQDETLGVGKRRESKDGREAIEAAELIVGDEAGKDNAIAAI